MKSEGPQSEDRAVGAIRRLHARYDGAIPTGLRQAALAGGEARLDLLKAEARRLMFDGLAREAGAALALHRRRLANGNVGADRTLAALARDLRFYRDQGARSRR